MRTARHWTQRSASGGTAGVAYWETNEGEWNSRTTEPDGRLYRCTATNTWTLFYTPYAYPHPWAGGPTPPPGDGGIEGDGGLDGTNGGGGGCCQTSSGLDSLVSAAPLALLALTRRRRR